MSNRASSKQHGLHRAPRMRVKSKYGKRKNKANNRVRQAERQDAIMAAIHQWEAAHAA